MKGIAVYSIATKPARQPVMRFIGNIFIVFLRGHVCLSNICILMFSTMKVASHKRCWKRYALFIVVALDRNTADIDLFL